MIAFGSNRETTVSHGHIGRILSTLHISSFNDRRAHTYESCQLQEHCLKLLNGTRWPVCGKGPVLSSVDGSSDKDSALDGFLQR